MVSCPTKQKRVKNQEHAKSSFAQSSSRTAIRSGFNRDNTLEKSMSFNRFAILSLLLLMTSCATNTSVRTERISITTREWISPSFRDIHAAVVVDRLGAQVFSSKYDFSVPLDPVGGVNPSEFHFFTYCLASKLAKQHGYTHWALGALDKNLKYQMTTELELYVAVLNEKDSPPMTVGGNTIQWLDKPVASDSLYSFCSKLLRPQFMWAKAG